MTTTDSYASARDTTEGRVFTVTGGDWDEVAGHRPDRRGADRRQHGPAAPVHARRTAAGPGAGRRDGHRGPYGRRLPAHRDREEPGVPQLDPGHHVRDPDGLPLADVQRGRVLHGGREAARHLRPDHRAGAHDPDAHDGAEPDLLAPGLAGDDRHGAGRDVHDDLRVPGARVHPGHLRDHQRPADEPRVHPAGRPGPGPARRGGHQDPGVPVLDAEPASTRTRTCCRAARSGRRAPRAWPSSTCRAASRSASPARCCARPGCRGTCARPCRTPATRRTTSTSSPAPTPTCGAGTRSGSTRCGSR